MIRFGGFFVKHAFRLSSVSATCMALAFFLTALNCTAQAQTVSATPESAVVQITNTVAQATFSPTPTASPSPTPTPAPLVQRNSFASDISGNGRFVVIESSGDISTEKTSARNNVDGNIEIFLFDYAQRRIFQITNTRNALKNTAGSPTDVTNIDVDVRSVRPMISHDGRFIVFSSNAYSNTDAAQTPIDFDGNNASNLASLKADGNTEIFLYAIPAVADVDLSSGVEVPDVNLGGGTITRLTNTPASRLPTAGVAGTPPFVADDNRSPFINDDGSIIAFVSTRNIPNSGGLTNNEAIPNPEIFIFHRPSGAFIQATNTAANVLNDNPNLSGDGSVLAFASTGDINSTEVAANRGNQELYVANFNGSVVSNLRPVTSTPKSAIGDPVIALNPGRRLSRNGNLLAFETLADLQSNGAVNGALKDTFGSYVYNIGANTFFQVASRPPTGQLSDVLRFPTFTGDSANVVFASTLNLRATTGEALAQTSTDGINVGTADSRFTQIFSVPVPSGTSAPANYSRLSRMPAVFGGVQPFATDTLRRTAFSLSGTELGGGNSDASSEAFYLLVPAASGETTGTITFTTGASERAVVSASPAPTPPAVTNLAPGMLGIARSSLTLAPSSREVDKNNVDETTRRPPLPVELNGVSVAIANAAAGLYFVSEGQINFVVPVGLLASTTALPVVINNNGTVIRTTLVVNTAQPDIFTSTNGAAGRAAVLNVTNPCVAATGEPFSVTTTRPTGGVCTATTTETVPTQLLIMLTGVRNLATAAITVRIKDTDITGTNIVSVGPSRTTGFDQIVVNLPATLAGAGDSTIIVTATTTAGTFTSRAADTAPHITIQ